MDNVKTDSYYIQKIRKDLEFIIEHMRNVDIVHDYGNVDLNVVYETLQNDIPELLELLTEKQ